MQNGFTEDSGNIKALLLFGKITDLLEKENSVLLIPSEFCKTY